MAKKRGVKPIPLERQFPDDKATLEWLKSQEKSTLNAYKSLWKWFLEYAKMSGNQIVADRKQDKDYSWEKKALEFHKWSQQHTCEKHKKPLSEGGAKTTLGMVRGFFNYHRLDLRFRNTTKRKLAKKPKRVREDFKLAKETIARMSVQANLRDRYVLVVGKSLGLRAIDFIGLKIGDFTCLDLDGEPPISMGKMHTIKEAVPSFPFLDSDAIPIVKAYLESIDTSNPDVKMLRIGKNELTRILKDLAQKANVNVGNKHLRFHCLRKFLIDRLSAVMSESKWKQVIGKKISEDAYVSEEQLREAYGRAMPETTFSNHNHRVMRIQELENAITTLSKEHRGYRATIEVLTKKIEGFERTMKLTGEVQTFYMETQEFMKDLDRRLKETDKAIKNLKKQGEEKA